MLGIFMSAVAKIASICLLTLEQNKPGLENLALILALWGASVQNIGAYGVDLLLLSIQMS